MHIIKRRNYLRKMLRKLFFIYYRKRKKMHKILLRFITKSLFHYKIIYFLDTFPDEKNR